FLGAAPGSTLEIHGKQKKSWTKLVATLSPVKRGSCGLIYDSADQDIKKRTGIWMNIWNSDGSLFSLEAFDLTESRVTLTIPDVVEKIRRIPFGKIVAIAVQKTIGTPTEMYEDLYTAIESLGGYQIRNVRDFEPYVLIAEKGKPSCAVEQAVETHVERFPGVERPLETTTIFAHGHLAYFARSYTEIEKNKDEVRFRVLHRDAAFPKLSFLHDVTSWQPGDEIVVASTDYKWRQAEVKTIVSCNDCEPNQIRVHGDFQYSHFGEVTFGVDERAEVGLLSRNIRIDAELQNVCYNYTEHEKALCDIFKRDTYGGHTKVIGGAWARIEGVQLTNMGQQSTLATYPLHFHLADAVPGQYVRNNVIRDSNSRCITVHGTDYLEVSDNVCLNHIGHGIFLEDSAEQNNVIHRNLAIGTQYGTLLFTDMDTNFPMCINRDYCALLSTFWITHPNNNFTDNVAAGSDGSGFVFAFSDRPLGPSLPRMIKRGLYEDMSTRYMKVAKFSGNVMHSNQLAGLWFDNRLSYGQTDMNKYVPENAKMGLNNYSPRDPPNENGTLTETVLSELTFYKNEDRNAWVRCGNIVIANSSFADSPTSYAASHTMRETYCNVRDSIFIGETDNKGEPYTHIFHREFPDMPKSQRPSHQFDRSIARGRPEFTISGVQFYQGPSYVNNCFFDQFKNWYYNDSFVDQWGIRPLRPAAAINFHPNNHYPMVPRNGVSNVKFGFCDGSNDSFRVMDGNASTPWWNVFDGTENIIFRDYDGSLTTTADASIVKDRPFFTGDRCLKKPDWNLAICPYKYTWMVVRGSSGVLQNKYKGKTPVLISRDDHPEDVYVQKGIVGHKYNLRAYKSYTVWFNSTVGPAPRDIQFRPRYGLENNETLRFAVCLPKSTNNFTIYSTFPDLNPKRELPTWVDNLEDLDDDETMKAFYWDKENGYLYFKMTSPYSFTRPGQECAGDVCMEVNINRDDGDDEPAVCNTPVPPWYFKDRYPRVKNRSCKNPDSPEGLGAPIETGYLPPPAENQTCGF
ncbi:hypothetical protein EGW08_016452, partial [Elysia chlorotica]